ncbi:protein THEM6-like [Maniola hyperantus]|uniref:protein THEM6-like n=1 Tax=Aphantopus hyperantus TaxID=2795564 RepID=UPI0037488FB2
MVFLCYSVMIICMIYMICDVNYVLRTCFTVFSGRLYQKRYTLRDITTVYGICTFQDCDVGFKSIRIARLIREIDFARYHFYDRTGIYHRSRQIGIRSLQGATFTISMEPVPLFVPYKINTKLIYWDDKSIFFEHEVVTLHDNKVRCLLVSRQYGIGNCKETMADLLKGFCTTQDVDLLFDHLNNARYVREADFARVHFYVRTRLFKYIKAIGGHVLQGATSIRYRRTIPIFTAYKIETKLAYWDDKSLFIEQKFVTFDGFVRAIILSRQNLVNVDVETLLKNIPGVEIKPDCSQEIKYWLQAIEASSMRLRNKD